MSLVIKKGQIWAKERRPDRGRQFKILLVRGGDIGGSWLDNGTRVRHLDLEDFKNGCYSLVTKMSQPKPVQKPKTIPVEKPIAPVVAVPSIPKSRKVVRGCFHEWDARHFCKYCKKPRVWFEMPLFPRG